MNNIIESFIKEYMNNKKINTAIIDVPNLVITEYLRKACEQNHCGKYGTNWMCPPGVGSIKDLTKKLKQFDKGLVIQTIHQLEDSFDYEGMMISKEKHTSVFVNILNQIKKDSNFDELLPLNVGACEICDKCAYLNGEKCIFPDKAMASVEAYGIDVNSLLKSCDLEYNNGTNTVSYVGVIFFKTKD